MKEQIQKAIDALEYHTAQTRPINKTDEVIAELKAALSKKIQYEISDDTLQTVANAVIDYHENGDDIYFDGLRKIINEQVLKAQG